MSKYCYDCKQTKSKSEFYKNKSKKDGLSSQCKACVSTYGKDYLTSEYGKEAKRKTKVKYNLSEKGKECNKNYRKAYAASEHGKEVRYRSVKRYPQRTRARRIIGNSIRRGKIKPAKEFTCNHCPNQAAGYHHHNGYSPEHKIDVIPLCRKCHGEADKNVRLSKA